MQGLGLEISEKRRGCLSGGMKVWGICAVNIASADKVVLTQLKKRRKMASVTVAMKPFQT